MYAAEWPCCHDPLRFSLGSDDLSPSRATTLPLVGPLPPRLGAPAPPLLPSRSLLRAAALLSSLSPLVGSGEGGARAARLARPCVHAMRVCSNEPMRPPSDPFATHRRWLPPRLFLVKTRGARFDSARRVSTPAPLPLSTHRSPLTAQPPPLLCSPCLSARLPQRMRAHSVRLEFWSTQAFKPPALESLNIQPFKPVLGFLEYSTLQVADWSASATSSSLHQPFFRELGVLLDVRQCSPIEIPRFPSRHKCQGNERGTLVVTIGHLMKGMSPWVFRDLEVLFDLRQCSPS